MREIKFRAWQRYQKIMLKVKKIEFDPFRLTINNSENILPRFNGRDLIAEKCFYLMQYTGLKDCKGVEIYESDLITDSHFTWEVYFCEKTASVRCKLVSHCNAVINDNLLKTIIDKRALAKMPIIVIGNIYENVPLNV